MDTLVKLAWVKVILYYRTIGNIVEAQKTLIKKSFIEIKYKNIANFIKDFVIPYLRLKKLQTPQNIFFNTKG